jgi:hypothetical protein
LSTQSNFPNPAASPNPAAVTNLEAIYGSPSQTGFGSAVFHKPVEQSADLEVAALEYYRYFLGNQWERFGEDTWMAAWRQVYLRPGNTHSILTELRSISDPDAGLCVSMILDNISDPDAGQKALSATYDDIGVENLVVYTLGDGAAMSGLLIAGRYSGGEAIFLVFLMD